MRMLKDFALIDMETLSILLVNYSQLHNLYLSQISKKGVLYKDRLKNTCSKVQPRCYENKHTFHVAFKTVDKCNN